MFSIQFLRKPFIPLRLAASVLQKTFLKRWNPFTPRSLSSWATLNSKTEWFPTINRSKRNCSRVPKNESSATPAKIASSPANKRTVPKHVSTKKPRLKSRLEIRNRDNRLRPDYITSELGIASSTSSEGTSSSSLPNGSVIRRSRY